MRLLEDTIASLIEGVTPRGDAAEVVRLNEVDMSMPLVLHMTPGLQLIADFPRSRWWGDLDPLVSLLKVKVTVRSNAHE